MSDERLTLREMCDRFRVTPRTLRHYEYIELLAPEKLGRTRFYGPTEIARLKLILRGRRFGFSLEESRQWLLLYDSDPENRVQMETWIEWSGHQLKELAQRRVELDETITELQRLHDQTVEAYKK